MYKMQSLNLKATYHVHIYIYFLWQMCFTQTGVVEFS